MTTLGTLSSSVLKPLRKSIGSRGSVEMFAALPSLVTTCDTQKRQRKEKKS